MVRIRMRQQHPCQPVHPLAPQHALQLLVAFLCTRINQIGSAFAAQQQRVRLADVDGKEGKPGPVFGFSQSAERRAQQKQAQNKAQPAAVQQTNAHVQSSSFQTVFLCFSQGALLA